MKLIKSSLEHKQIDGDIDFNLIWKAAAAAAVWINKEPRKTMLRHMAWQQMAKHSNSNQKRILFFARMFAKTLVQTRSSSLIAKHEPTFGKQQQQQQKRTTRWLWKKAPFVWSSCLKTWNRLWWLWATLYCCWWCSWWWWWRWSFVWRLVDN